MSAHVKLWWRDASERVLATYLQALIGLLLANGLNLTDVDELRAAAVAAIPAGLAALKAIIASRVPGTISPASLAES